LVNCWELKQRKNRQQQPPIAVVAATAAVVLWPAATLALVQEAIEVT